MRTAARTRGTCPHCGKGEVIHIDYGMVFPAAITATPDWVEFAGCVIFPDSTAWRCDACGFGWNRDREGS